MLTVEVGSSYSFNHALVGSLQYFPVNDVVNFSLSCSSPLTNLLSSPVWVQGPAHSSCPTTFQHVRRTIKQMPPVLNKTSLHVIAMVSPVNLALSYRQLGFMIVRELFAIAILCVPLLTLNRLTNLANNITAVPQLLNLSARTTHSSFYVITVNILVFSKPSQ